MKNIYYIAAGLLMMVMVSCNKDQLRIDQRQTSFNVNYFTYSRFQLTSAIVDIATKYGAGVKEERINYCTLYSFDCYTPEKFGEFYTSYEEDWNMEGNPYTTSLRQLVAVKELATNEDNLANAAAADILKCVVGANLTEKYGDIPFSEASLGRTGNIFPKFDAQKDVYTEMFKLLDAAVVTLTADSKGLPADHDVLFGGDKTKWIKFANSLKFRLMAHSYEAFKKAGVDLAPQMQAIASGGQYMSANANNASLAFPGKAAWDSWYYTTVFGGTGNDNTEQKPTKYLIDIMSSFDDPRMYVIFAPALAPLSSSPTKYTETLKINNYSYDVTYYPTSTVDPSALSETASDANGTKSPSAYPLDAKWIGVSNPLRPELHYGSTGANIPGTNYPYDNRRFTSFSKLIYEKNGDALKAVIMESSEMAFLLAEARQKNWISTGTVNGFYKDGIRLSFERWKIENGTKPATQIGSTKIVDNFDDYYAKPGVALDNSSADLDKIAIQKWLSLLVVNPTEEFIDFRRSGKPAFLSKISAAFSAYSFPYRYMYPKNEYNNNKENYNKAVSDLGGKDLSDAKMWILR